MQTSLPSSTQFESCSFPSFETLHCTCMFCFCNYRKREKATCETFHIIIARAGLNCMYYWIFTYRVCCGHFFLIVFLCFVITSTRLIFPLIVTFIKNWQLNKKIEMVVQFSTAFSALFKASAVPGKFITPPG